MNKSRIKLTEKTKNIRNEAGDLVTVHQIRATADFPVTIIKGNQPEIVQIREGQLGGFVQESVKLGDEAWLSKDSIITGQSVIEGVTCGYTRVEDSTIGKGSIIGGRTVVVNSQIGTGVITYGTTALRNSTVDKDATIVGSIVRNSKIGIGAEVECAGVINGEQIGSRVYRTNRLVACN